MLTAFYEEKTPKGYTLKIVQKKLNFLVFDRNGSSVYSDPAGSQVMHTIPVVSFLGQDFSVKSRVVGEYNLYKVSRGKIIIPYTLYGNTENRYLLIDTAEEIDIMPVKTIFYEQILPLVRDIDQGIRPDYIVIDNNITANDLVVIRNRIATSVIINIMDITHKKQENDEPEHRRALDEMEDYNLNTLSQNPVYLARIHLRVLAVAKVKQLLLDFDLTSVDAGYILTFISVMLKGGGEEVEKSRNALVELEKDFRFYIAVVDKNKDLVRTYISEVTGKAGIASYMTLLAKARSIYDDYNNDMDMVDIENMLMEKQEELSR